MTTVGFEQVTVAGAVVRFWTATDEVVGGGFLVGSGLVATCAHVVADALGTDPYAPNAPTARMQLDFPLLLDDNGSPLTAAAVVDRWVPIAEDGSGDIALLRFAGTIPAAARMPPVHRVERLWDHTFWVLGFPTAAAGGAWSSGLIRGAQGTRWFQLQSTPGEARIEGGFSGAPVWDAASEAVVGMTVAADRGDTTTAYLIPIDQVLGLDPELLPNPYRGLEPFDEAHASTFFGRDAEVGRLLDALERLPVVAVAGPSGAGKSSLVRAGLLPRLRASGATIVDVQVGADALVSLDGALAGAAGRADVVLVVDQFEELAAADPLQARALLDRIVLATAPGGPSRSLRAVLTLRWAALDDLMTPTLIETLETGTVLVAPLDRTQLRDAIVLPAERAPGLAFEAGLVDRILADAGTEPGQLPLVESLLSELWEHRDRGYLTVGAYEAAGGVAGAVAKHAEKVVAAVGDEDALRRLFTALARPDRDGRFVRRPVPLVQLPEEQLAIVPLLTAGRLVVVSGDAVELAHQALIEHWPRLHEWLAADHEFLEWRSWLDTQRERWETENRDDAALLRGATLDAADEWLPARVTDLPPAGLDYLKRSTDRRRRDVRRRRVVAAVLAVLVLVATTLSIVAIDRQRALRADLATANANALGAEAQSHLTTEPVLAAQLALAAWRADPHSTQARTALGNSYLAMQSVEAVVPGLTESTIVDMVAAGDSVILKQPAGLLAVTGLAGPTPTTWQLPDSARATSSDTSLAWHRAVSRDGRLLADVSANGTVRVRDLTTRGEPVPIPDTGGSGQTPADGIAYPRFTPDGGRIAWAAGSRGGPRLVIRDVRTGAVVPHAIPQFRDVFSVWFTPDPNLLLIREGITGKPPTRLAVHSLSDGVVTPLPTGSEVARGGAASVTCEAGNPADESAKAVVVVTPVAAAEPTRRITGANADCDDEHLSADGGWLVENASPGEKDYSITLRLTDLLTGEVRQTVAPRFDGRTVFGKDPLSTAPAIAVDTRDGRTSVLLAQGTSLQRLATRPGIVADTGGRYANGLGGTLTFTADQQGVLVAERGTGRELGVLPGPHINVASVDSHTLWTVKASDGAWVFDKYEVPTLHRIGGFRLPTANPHVNDPDRIARRIELATERPADGGRVLVMDDGMLSVWDPAGAQQLGPAVHVATTPGSPEFVWTRLWVRPGHPGQVAALGADMSVQLWDTLGGRLLHTLPTKLATKLFGEPSQVAFDPSGARIAVLNANKTIEVWDADTGAPARPPIAAPDTEDLVGFAADGYLAVLDQVGISISGVAFVDTQTGLSAGSIAARGGLLTMAEDGRTVRGFSARGVAPPEVPVIATVWRDALCAASNRPFTPAELRLLRPGLDTSPPCS